MGITVLVTAAAFLIAAAPALAAPANDNFADAQVANTGDTNPTSGSNVDATKEAGEPNHAGDAGGASVWYRWTAPSSGAATVDTCDSNFDTLLGVYTGDSVSSLAVVGSSDDDCVAGRTPRRWCGRDGRTSALLAPPEVGVSRVPLERPSSPVTPRAPRFRHLGG